MSPVFPIALHARNRLATIVGGGSVALRKARSLLSGGFRLSIVAPHIVPDLRAMAERGNVSLLERAYESGDLHGALLAVAATGDEHVDARVVADAHALNILVCDATIPERGDLTMLAISRIGDVTIALDSGGSTPSFSRRMLREIEAQFDAGYGAAAANLARMRTYARTVFPKDERIALLRELAELPIEELATMNIRRLICASRASALAKKQARIVAALAARRGVMTGIVELVTAGDRVTDRPIHEVGGMSIFVKELESALRDRRADYAVHSCKDIPSEIPDDMEIVAISKREDPRDAFCSEQYASFGALPAGATIGTSSPRRLRQLQALRADLQYEEIRGNVDTRLRKLRDGTYDAIVLAMAGLNRLGVTARYTVPFSVEEVVPAAAQGALAVEMRAGENAMANELRSAVNDDLTERCVRCERAVLRTLRAGCSMPIGVHARFVENRLVVDGIYSGSDRTQRQRVEGDATTPEMAEALGVELAKRLL